MGKVYTRSGYYYLYYCFEGKRYREATGTRNKRLAEDILKKREIEIRENKFFDVKRKTKIKFKDFAAEYLERHAKPNKRSWENCDSQYINRFNQYFGEKLLFQIDLKNIDQYRGFRLQSVSKSMVNRETRCLRTMLNKAIEWNYLSENPVKKIKDFSERDCERTRYLSPDELSRLLDACYPLLKAFVTIAVHTGMRINDLRFLRWQDIDFHHNKITFVQQKTRERTDIPMNDVMRKTLLSIHKSEKSPYIFASDKGKPSSFKHAFENARRRAGIQDFRFHDLRHTFATYLRMSHVDLKTIMELLGQKSFEMVLRYSHADQDFKKHAVGNLVQMMPKHATNTPQNESRREDAESDNIANVYKSSTYKK